ncbi:MAG: hypothetical protein WCG81_11020, partial [Candidatus Angelobacter sp.]
MKSSATTLDLTPKENGTKTNTYHWELSSDGKVLTAVTLSAYSGRRQCGSYSGPEVGIREFSSGQSTPSKTRGLSLDVRFLVRVRRAESGLPNCVLEKTAENSACSVALLQIESRDVAKKAALCGISARSREQFSELQTEWRGES